MLFHAHPLEGEDCRPLSEWRQAVEGADRLLCALTVAEPVFDAADLTLPTYDLGAPRNVRGDANVKDLDDLRGAYLLRTGALGAIQTAAEQAYEALS